MADSTETRKIAVRNYVEDDKLATDTSYSLTNLSDAMQQQAGLLAHYARQAAKASRQVDDLKLVLQAAESAVYRSERDNAVKAGEKVTDTRLDHLVAGSARVIAIKRALNEAKQIEAIAKGAVEAIKHKRDMLIQEGATSREERKGELRMLGAAERDAALEDAKQRLLARLGTDE